MKWAVEIQKTGLERRNLADLLDGLGFNLIDGLQFPEFTSPEFEACETSEDVFEKAKQVRSAFIGATGIDPEFTFGAVKDYTSNPPKSNYFLEVQSSVSKVSFGNVTLTHLPPSGLTTAEFEKWNEDQIEREYQVKLEDQRAKLEPAFREPNAEKVLELLCIENHTGETIYKIYELAEGHPNNRNTFQRQFGISDDQFKRFGDAVHNPTVSGSAARHAYEDPPKTINPMTMIEAEDFVRNIALNWLKHVRTSYITNR